MHSDSKLGTEKIGKLMLRMALPAVVAQMINLLYNLVDRIYIGHIEGEGQMALTGLGICFPLLMIVSAFSSFAGMGGAPLAAIELGKGDHEKAERILGNAVFMLIVSSAVLTGAFLVFKEQLLYAFGASANTIGYASDYLGIYLIGTLFVQLALGLNGYISAQGRSFIAMMSVAIGAVLNIILDPIFIFTMSMGVKGAALATIISQGVSAVWVVGFLFVKSSSLRIRIRMMRPQGRIIGKIAALGVSPFIMQVTESAIVFVFNNGLLTYGNDLYVGTITILQSVLQVCIVPVQGFTQGVQPIISYNYGAKNYGRVQETINRMQRVIIPLMAIVCIAACVFPKAVVSVFTDGEELRTLAAQVMPVFLCGMSIFGIQMCAQSAFIGLGQAKVSLFIALLRKVILIIPLALILPRLGLGVWGIYLSEPISDVISATTAGVLLRKYRRKLLTNGDEAV
ncbi:MAG: MATE family efflux transporter [Christensenellaceae bacterium]|nr:MATE family efflux transporter [Christensenellaceae bacterium]